MNKVVFRCAKEKDILFIRNLVRNSEAIWGFDESFLRIFDENYNVTTDFINENIAYVMIKDDIILGFWGLIVEEQGAELEYFYIESSQTGKGFGKQLWNHMEDWCHSNGIRRIDFVTSHPAVEFYKRCGAVLNGTTHSYIDGREIPKLYCEFK